MKAKLSYLLLCLCSLILVFGVTACDVDNQTTTNGNTGKTTESTVSEEEKKLDEEVFPKDKVVDVKITIDENDFQDMLDNASDEEMKTASVDYNGRHFDNIGIRTKGNLSLRSVVQMEDSDRYSFKLSFDEYVNQTLDGISKINLNNNYSDASYMREFLAYEFAAQMGLPTPKFSYVNVYINDELWGFYLAIEQVGDAYLERHFGNSYGALYKGEMTGTGSELTWLGDDPNSYTGLAQKSKTSNGNILIDMLNELNNGSDYEKYINVETALKYIALNVATNNTDSYIGQNKQNYYLYEDEGVFSILPWDYNMAFGGLGGGMGGGMGEFKRDPAGNAPDVNASDVNASADNAPDVNAPDADNKNNGDAAVGKTNNGKLLIDEPTSGALADRPLVAKLLAVDEYKGEYHNILKEAIEGYLADDNFTARVNELSEMISSYVEADPTAFYTYDQYKQALPQLISSNASQIENIAQQLDGTIPSSGDGSGSGGGMGGGKGGAGMGGNRPAMAPGNGVQADQAQQAVPNNKSNADQSQPQQGGAGQQGAQEQGANDVQMPQMSNNEGMPVGQDTQQDGIDNQGQQGANNVPQNQDQADPSQQSGMDGQGNFPQWNGEGDFPQLNGKGGFPGGFDGPGGKGEFGQGANQAAGSTSEAIATGISLVIIVLACVFVARFRRRR